jgi:predicted glycoside hydrolase/deacetylase ChbG (UPF0249 family)
VRAARIILSADDFGYSADTVAATIGCLEQGALTGASLMVNMPATDQALAYARAHPEHSYGVHLTFAGDGLERALTADVPDLAGPDGRFHAPGRVRLLALLGRLSVDQIERELLAQLALVRDHGVPIAHVDSHHHTHKFAPFRAALCRVLPRFGIRRVRGVQDLYLRRPFRSPTYWLGPLWQRALRARFVSTDHFYMPATTLDTAWADALLDHLPGGTTLEVGVHPGTAEPWRASEREQAVRFAARARAAGHQLIGWKDL